MTLRTRILLMVTGLLAVAVLATNGALAWTAYRSLLAQTEADGLLIAHLLAQSAGYADELSEDVEAVIGEQMVVQATVVAHLVQIAEQAGLDPERINAHFRLITERSTLDEIWVTDEQGRAYLTNRAGIDFTFTPDARGHPQASLFWLLLSGQPVIIQEARRRDLDGAVFKYAGVEGVDKPRIVQVGYRAGLFDWLRRQIGVARLVDDLVDAGSVAAIRVVDSGLTTLTHGVAPGKSLDTSPTAEDTDRLRGVVDQGGPASYLDRGLLKVAFPIITRDAGTIAGAVLVLLPTDHLTDALRDQLRAAGMVAALVLACGILASMLLSRRVTGPVAGLTAAAAAIEAETFEPGTLIEISKRPDELGQLARVFDRMAREVYAREQRLKQQVEALRVEIDQAARQREVTEITETEYFQQLEQRATELRAGPADPPSSLP